VRRDQWPLEMAQKQLDLWSNCMLYSHNLHSQRALPRPLSDALSQTLENIGSNTWFGSSTKQHFNKCKYKRTLGVHMRDAFMQTLVADFGMMSDWIFDIVTKVLTPIQGLIASLFDSLLRTVRHQSSDPQHDRVGSSSWLALPPDINAIIKKLVFKDKLLEHAKRLKACLRQPMQMHQPCVNLHTSEISVGKYRVLYRTAIRNHNPMWDTFEVRYPGNFCMLDVETNTWWHHVD